MTVLYLDMKHSFCDCTVACIALLLMPIFHISLCYLYLPIEKLLLILYITSIATKLYEYYYDSASLPTRLPLTDYLEVGIFLFTN